MSITLERALEIIALQSEKILTLEAENADLITKLEEKKNSSDFWFNSYLNIEKQLDEVTSDKQEDRNKIAS